MFVELKKLNFRIFAKNGAKMYDLLETNRARIAPWFWWATKSITPNKIRFYIFMTLYIADTKRKSIAHKINKSKTYDEQFYIYNDGAMAGMIGIDNIDTQNQKNAEIWYLTFHGNPFCMVDSAIRLIENYSIDMGLESLYAKIQSENKASIQCALRNGFVHTDTNKCAQISKHNLHLADMFTYTKRFVR